MAVHGNLSSGNCIFPVEERTNFDKSMKAFMLIALLNGNLSQYVLQIPELSLTNVLCILRGSGVPHPIIIICTTRDITRVCWLHGYMVFI